MFLKSETMLLPSFQRLTLSTGRSQAWPIYPSVKNSFEYEDKYKSPGGIILNGETGVFGGHVPVPLCASRGLDGFPRDRGDYRLATNRPS